MRINIILKGNGPINLPLSYNQTIQGFLYKNLSDPYLRDFIHNKGFNKEKRIFKFFSFSRLEGNFKINNNKKRIIFTDKVTLKVTSMFPPFIENLANTLIKEDNLTLGTNIVKAKEVFLEKPSIEENMKIKTLSPIVIYSTLSNENKKFTHYYSPQEKQFATMIKENLIRKASIFNSKSKNMDFEIKTISYNKNPNIIRYKNFIIKGWMGTFELKGDIELIKIAYNYGLGSKNSQGFGMIEKIS
ncbi:CRISPR-associated endoribonuclease Cas6 [Defluviitalea phaphyphila]|uniref:CRISPR-associated endoribonuclease Cas6 n=1 Tax=Defluviitalea phaphyphila TaxID=1473580 RepID=UPI0007316241|nr:CRISPR-associated endoribonuclease Cas6 [Defluviitalea phaphyphila]